MLESLEKLFNRDLNALIDEINRCEGEESLWQVKPGVTNTAGNLCLHICGNLQHFIGGVLGHSGYVRDREWEFSAKAIAAEELIKEIDTTRAVVSKTLREIAPEELSKTYPISLWNASFTTEFFLIHLHSHLMYHLGQINYLRRLIESSIER